MKKITYLLLLLFASVTFSFGQASSSSFTQSSSTYTPITGGTMLGADNTDDQRFVDPAITLGGTTATGVGFPIGFNLTFNGFVYDRFAVNANGWISFGSSASTPSVNINSSSSYNPLSSTSTTTTNDLVARFAPLGRDLQSQVGGEIRYELSGTSPNQVLTVQWTNYRKYAATGDSYNFQVKLYETTNVLRAIYGTMTSSGTSTTVQTGIRANPANVASNFNSRTTTTDWSASTASATVANSMTLSASVFPASGLTYTWTPPTCLTPNGTAISAITTNSATLTFVAPSPAPANGYQYSFSTTNVLPSGSGTPTNNLSNNLSVLMPSTTYYVFVRSDCGSGDFSNWTSAVSFTTACNTFTAPFTETFENGGVIPNCWTNAGTADTWKFANTGTGNHIGNNGTITGSTTSGGYFAWVDDSGTTSPDVTLTTPLIDVSSLTIPRLTFYELSNNEGFLNSELNVSVYDGAAWNLLATYNTNTVGGWEKKTIDLSTLTITGPIQVKFVVTEQPSDFYDDIAIDDVTVEETPSCAEPTLLNSSAITSNSATVSWTTPAIAPANGYEYYLSTSNTVPTAATIPTGNVAAGITTVNLMTLTSSTQYYIWVRSVCSSSSSSSWSTSITFLTLCDAVNVPYLQDFESVTVPALPICTSAVNSGTGNTWATAGAAAASGFTTNMLRYTYNFTNPANTTFFTQGINLTAGTSYRISYNYGNSSTTYTESLKVDYGTDATVAAMTNSLANHPTINQNAIQFNQVDFTPTTTGVYYFGFNAYSVSNQFYLFVDNITVDVTPACSAPINLVASPIADMTAILNWSTVASATDYQYILDTTAADPAGSGTTITTNTYNATGLTPTTTYYFHVRTNCGGTFSAWSTLMFTTLATPPANDECSDAVTLTAGGVYGEFLTDGTNDSATLSSQASPTTCFGFNGGDIWYSVVVPASGSITVETGNSSTGATGIDTVITAYSGTCGALTQVSCDDDGGTTGAYSMVALTGQVAGSTIYIRVYEYGNNNFGGFGISAYDGSLGTSNFDSSKFIYYPNPVNDILNIQYSQEISQVQVINLLGQEVISKALNASQGQIDMSGLPAGTYLVKVTADGSEKTIKVLKQ